jgi:hypothetical protein
MADSVNGHAALKMADGSKGCLLVNHPVAPSRIDPENSPLPLGIDITSSVAQGVRLGDRLTVGI